MYWFALMLNLIAIPALSPLLIGCIRTIKARFQNRVGASVLQPYRDIAKLFHKHEVVSEHASIIFLTAPYIIFTITLIVGASIPLFANAVAFPLLSDLLVIIYLLGLGTFFLALAGMDTGSGFGGFGSSREMTMAALAEAGLIFSLLATAFIARSSSVLTIASTDFSGAHIIPLALAGIGFFIAILCESARFPFDNPATHLELTMIHEAMILEYSGKRLALIEWASSNKLFIFLALTANLFLPFGMIAITDIFSLMIATLIFLMKILFLGFLIAALESSIAKFRFFRLPDLLFSSVVLSVISIGLTLSL